jgi:hypothetical protein
MKLASSVQVVFATCMILLFGCTNPGPREVAEKYLDALARLEFAAAAQVVADEGKASLDLISQLHQTLTPEEQEKFRLRDWQVVGHQQQGTRATVDFLFDKTKKGQLILINYAGTWKVVSRKTF